MGRTRSQSKQTGLTLDSGALIGLERGAGRAVALLRRALDEGFTLRVPAGVLAQVWRDGRTQSTLARFLRTADVRIVPLDDQRARACGELCAATGTSDIIDASVVITARAQRDTIVTGDPDDLRRLDPTAVMIQI